MKSAPRLQFLRPFAWKPLEVRNPGYLRFYHLARHRELVQANALKYPRIRHDGVPMRIPVFREKYEHIQHGTLAEDEVIVRGRVQFVRLASSKLVFVALKSEFEQLQAMLSFKRLEAAGVPLNEFKEWSKLLNRGDILCASAIRPLSWPVEPAANAQQL